MKYKKLAVKALAACTLLIGSSYVHANKLSEWKEAHLKGELGAVMDIAFWVCMVTGLILVITSLLAWRNLTSGNPNQKVSQMGGVGIGVGFLIGAGFLAITWVLSFIVGTATGAEQDDAFEELRSSGNYEYRVEIHDDRVS